MTKQQELKLKLKLIEKIEKWASENCEKDFWPSVFVHDDFETDMANAAMAVFRAMADSQEQMD